MKKQKHNEVNYLSSETLIPAHKSIVQTGLWHVALNPPKAGHGTLNVP